MKTEQDVLKFRIGKLNLALPVSEIIRVIWNVEIKPLPGAPAFIHGVISLEGQAVPIFDFRKRLKMRAKKPGLSDRIVIAATRSLTFGFLCDHVEGVMEIESLEISSSGAILPGKNEFIEGIAITGSDIIYIYDTDSFLSIEEEQQLQKAMNTQKKKKKKRSVPARGHESS